MYFLCDSNVTRKSAYIIYTSAAADENEMDLCVYADRRQHQSLVAPKLIGKGTYVIHVVSQQPRSLTMYRVLVPPVGEPRVRTLLLAEAPTMMEGNHANHDTPLTSSVAVSPM